MRELNSDDCLLCFSQDVRNGKNIKARVEIPFLLFSKDTRYRTSASEPWQMAKLAAAICCLFGQLGGTPPL